MSCTMPEGEDLPAIEFAAPLMNWADAIAYFRSQRAAVFGSDLFYEPAWDILLHLASRPPAESIELSAIVSAIGGSQETTSRWLQILVSRGEVDVGASRFILSPKGRENLLKVMQSRGQQ